MAWGERMYAGAVERERGVRRRRWSPVPVPFLTSRAKPPGQPSLQNSTSGVSRRGHGDDDRDMGVEGVFTLTSIDYRFDELFWREVTGERPIKDRMFIE